MRLTTIAELRETFNRLALQLIACDDGSPVDEKKLLAAAAEAAKLEAIARGLRVLGEDVPSVLELDEDEEDDDWEEEEEEEEEGEDEDWDER